MHLKSGYPFLCWFIRTVEDGSYALRHAAHKLTLFLPPRLKSDRRLYVYSCSRETSSRLR
jgi:hypothetical protein